jgi:hypothetical protein
MDSACEGRELIPSSCVKGLPADLTPTYTAVNNRFQSATFLDLVLVDETTGILNSRDHSVEKGTLGIHDQ